MFTSYVLEIWRLWIHRLQYCLCPHWSIQTIQHHTQQALNYHRLTGHHIVLDTSDTILHQTTYCTRQHTARDIPDIRVHQSFRQYAAPDTILHQTPYCTRQHTAPDNILHQTPYCTRHTRHQNAPELQTVCCTRHHIKNHTAPRLQAPYSMKIH